MLATASGNSEVELKVGRTGFMIFSFHISTTLTLVVMVMLNFMKVLANALVRMKGPSERQCREVSVVSVL